MIVQKPNHKLLLNLNASPLLTRMNDIRAVFADEKCVLCFDCIERALRAHRYSKYQPDSEELHSELLTNTISLNRNKRFVTSAPESRKDKNGKKKSKTHKKIIVTKYNVDGEVYALKVKESSESEHHEDEACQLYSVNKVMSCDSPDTESFISNVKKYKKGRKHQDRSEEVTERTVAATTPPKSLFKKRQTDEVRSQMPENEMSSVEEFY